MAALEARSNSGHGGVRRSMNPGGRLISIAHRLEGLDRPKIEEE
jgi:hypothetical protein